ncbi:MAG: metal ABC transporter substrate-binding protein [Lachnospiraceae bacterium]|uniref:metal ABC transporter substrate-binding protein n=1 Tax=Roseburia hominis TaxID=301301 RepID=UPI001F2C90E2|nr:metal ABC transporter substrate-binding protein [Lachnospiraceae bacterium]MDD6169887.1 metal ABC transporter substrate-binding protein [Lachnospiraceae bacterium]MDY4839094.1 metal ABC transporter substrate-binding protein [Lachnospiraceae bacterium]
MKKIRNKYVFTMIMLICLLFCGIGLTNIYVNHERENEKKEYVVVTSFYPMYVAAMNVIGDSKDVTLKNLSEPQTGCLHDYQLTPQDMRLLSGADVFIVNGGGIESFLDDVAKQYDTLAIINTSEKIAMLEDNAHVWMNVSDYEIQVQTIAEKLGELMPTEAKQFTENANAYLTKLDVLEQEINELKLVTEGQNIVIFHEAYDYVADELGMQVSIVMDLDEERQVSAGEVAEVMQVIESDKVSVVLAEELYGKDMGDTVEKETDAKVIYLDTLVRGDGAMDSYLHGMEQNIAKLKEAFGYEENH